MPARQPFAPSFFEFAQMLPDSDAVRLLRQTAPAIYCDRGGEAVEKHIVALEKVRDRWMSEFDAAPDETRRAIPLREGLRAMTAIERGHERRRQLREEAWLQARTLVFHQLGVRIALPETPEAAESRRQLENFAEVMGEPVVPRPSEAAAPVPAAPQPAPELTGKVIREGLHKLARARVGMKAIQDLKAEARSGKLTREQFWARVQELMKVA